jgi:uncharacterized protein (PEP-CTERM system associated)
VTRAASGDSGLTGRVDWDHALPNGRLGASLAHGFATDDDDAETRYTNASANYQTPLGPLTTLDLGLSWVQNVSTEDDGETRQGALNAGVSHMLGQDWSLGAGYRRIHRRKDDADWAESDALYFSFAREFSVRY